MKFGMEASDGVYIFMPWPDKTESCRNCELDQKDMPCNRGSGICSDLDALLNIKGTWRKYNGDV